MRTRIKNGKNSPPPPHMFFQKFVTAGSFVLILKLEKHLQIVRIVIHDVLIYTAYYAAKYLCYHKDQYRPRCSIFLHPALPALQFDNWAEAPKVRNRTGCHQIS